MDLFLNVKRRGVDDEVAPVLLIFPSPDELRIEVDVAGVADGFRALLFFLDKGLLLDGRNILPFGFPVLEGLDGFGGGFLGGHWKIGKFRKGNLDTPSGLNGFRTWNPRRCPRPTWDAPLGLGCTQKMVGEPHGGQWGRPIKAIPDATVSVPRSRWDRAG